MIRFTAPLTTPAAVELKVAKQALRIEHDEEDAFLNSLLVAATQAAEHELSRALVTQTWLCELPRFWPGTIELAMPPVQSITQIAYTDEDGTARTLDASQYTCSSHGLLRARAGWPQGRDVRITYQAGFGKVGQIPEAIVHWILLHVGALYENREALVPANVVPMGFAARLLDRYRIWTVG